MLHKDNFAPFIYAGPGLAVDVVKPEDESVSLGRSFFKFQYGLGIQYKISPRVGIKLFGEHNIVNSDELDNRINGTRDDFYFNFGVGLNYNFNWKKNKNKE